MAEPQLSPEEIQKRIELMKENCIFCKILKGEIPSYKVFEDDLCVAILDIRPTAKGQMILMPKEHYMMMPMVPDQVLGHISVISKYLCDLLKETYGYDDIVVQISNGAAAGQQIQHFFMSIIPKTSENKELFEVKKGSFSKSELEVMAKELKQKLQAISSSISS
jgi:histidine triad (HIT) family protein